MKKNKIIVITTLLTCSIFLFTWTACNKKAEYTAPIVPGNEPITTLRLIAQNINEPSDIDTGIWTQLNTNNGPLTLTQAHMTLKTNASYRVYVDLLDLDFPVSTDTPYFVTPLIEARKNFHLVCFQADSSMYGGFSVQTPGWGTTTAATLNIYREDSDANTHPLAVGLVDSFVTGADSSAGILDVTLHHQPNVKDGTCPPGSIDIEATDTIYISPHKH
jgi:hypothetical protein